MKLPIRFSLRDMILVTVIVALGLALWLTQEQVSSQQQIGQFPDGGPQTTIEGPLTVSYRERTSPNSTTGSNGFRLQSLHFMGDEIVFEYEDGRFRWFPKSRLEHLEWLPAE
ncbi:hypothetical protein NG895_07530 [Aeoliella sp. ICT_H6.2]|uniref:Uncharacterized protein n=1 Tax=Aeoliella straminimaris TaxID=2954799 RepID=A0A9X2F7P1_9BACT|nr:hypothetical protein [Aeoliella straminimaris]MCO6043755.1 hypothetical protein [Aeoliella straminimaris]